MPLNCVFKIEMTSAKLLASHHITNLHKRAYFFKLGVEIAFCQYLRYILSQRHTDDKSALYRLHAICMVFVVIFHNLSVAK